MIVFLMERVERDVNSATCAADSSVVSHQGAYRAARGRCAELRVRRACARIIAELIIAVKHSCFSVYVT